MSKIRGTNTKPEIAVRRIAYGLGFRYRLHAKDLPGSPDLVFRAAKKVIFVHGCFWHRHNCKKFCMPKSRISFWLAKFERNKKRDRSATRKLQRLGWKVLTIWECESSHSEKIAKRLLKFMQTDLERIHPR